jgi:hypothetical protein
MNIDKYINWGDIWENEVCLKTAIDDFGERDGDHTETIDVIKQFIKDTKVELIREECYLDDNYLYFFFSETGGQNESDTQGWSRDYQFVVDKDFLIINANYEQG